MTGLTGASWAILVFPELRISVMLKNEVLSWKLEPGFYNCFAEAQIKNIV